EIAGSDAQDEETPWVDDESLFALGNTVEIKMGYRDNLESLMIGEITSLEPEFISTRLPGLIVRGYDRRHRLLRGRKTRTFLQQKDSDIAAQIASEAGLTAQTEDSQVVHEYLLQANQSDLDFLRERARRIRYEVIVEDKTLIFRPTANAESETLTLTMDDDLLEFRPRLSSYGQVSEVTARSWNPKDKKELIGQAKAGDEVSKMGGQASGAEIAESAFGAAVELITERPAAAQAEADEQAKSRFNELLLNLVTGEGVSRGRTDLRSGKVIKIEGVGKRFSGQYYVSSAIHRYSPRFGYQTHFTVRRNAL
ncbi:MAG TPA: contractile injection system protein, VgrG/Pvc8 family, partial [Blastocatellia bacterium]